MAALPLLSAASSLQDPCVVNGVVLQTRTVQPWSAVLHDLLLETRRQNLPRKYSARLDNTLYSDETLARKLPRHVKGGRNEKRALTHLLHGIKRYVSLVTETLENEGRWFSRLLLSRDETLDRPILRVRSNLITLACMLTSELQSQSPPRGPQRRCTLRTGFEDGSVDAFTLYSALDRFLANAAEKWRRLEIRETSHTVGRRSLQTGTNRRTKRNKRRKLI